MTRQLEDLLLDLYSCAGERSRWPDVLDKVRHATHARSAVVQWLVMEEDCSWSRRTLRDSESQAASKAHDLYLADAVNPRMRQPLRRRVSSPSATILRDRDIFTADDPSFADLRDRTAAVSLGTFLSVSMPIVSDERVALVLHRDLDDPRDFDPGEEEFAIQLLPHLRQALQLTESLHCAQQRARELEQSLNSLRCAMVLCTPDARVCWTNLAADRIFAERDRVWVSGERLTSAAPQETARLRRMIEQAAQEPAEKATPGSQLLVLGRWSVRGAVQIQVQSIDLDGRESEMSNSPERRVLLIISAPGEMPVLPPELLAQAFALSPAESRLASALCRGLTVNEYAAVQNVSVSTARSQLKQIMAKTQVDRQSSLIQHMCSSVIAHILPRAS
jgi:DNA-binding CsgD family transcriptional regulator